MRLDSDTMLRPGSQQRVLDAFRDGHIESDQANEPVREL